MAVGKKTGGRKKGTPNKINKTIREMVVAALDEAGGKDYLLAQAKENPNAFLTLVGKVLPTQITGEGGGPVESEHTQTLDVSGLTNDQLRAIASIKADAD